MRTTENSVFRVSQNTIQWLDEYIRDLETVGKTAPMAMDALVNLMARADKGFAQKMSLGFLDPRQNRPDKAWQIPVRRITSRYFKGWRMKRVAPGVYRVINASREAWFIEMGIHPSGHVVIRPIARMALRETMVWLDQTRAGQRVWEVIYGPMRRGGGSKPRMTNFDMPAAHIPVRTNPDSFGGG